MEDADNATISEDGSSESESGSSVLVKGNCDESNLSAEQETNSSNNNLSNNVEKERNDLSEEEEEHNSSPVTDNNFGEELESSVAAAVRAAVAAAPPPRRYMQVEGFDGRRNDIVYCKPVVVNGVVSNEGSSESVVADAQSSERKRRGKLLLFFGGDIQDFPEMMEQHRDHRNYVSFNLEATAMTLRKQFPDHHIAVVRPSRIQMLTFSCYDNFVHCNHTGAPEHVITHHSLHHLQLLLQNLSKRISSGDKGSEQSSEDNGVIAEKAHSDEDATVSSTTVDESSTTAVHCGSKSRGAAANIRLDRASISLVGFSKGCVVLNQLLYEFHYLKTLTPDDLSMDEFLNCIKDMYWLDGGHNGGKNTWITSRSLLETLTRLGVRIHVHLTPYQLLDDRRPWIRKEEKLFSDLLKKFSAPIVRQIHFEAEPATLQQHLRIISQFASASPEVSKSQSLTNMENNMEH